MDEYSAEEELLLRWLRLACVAPELDSLESQMPNPDVDELVNKIWRTAYEI